MRSLTCIPTSCGVVSCGPPLVIMMRRQFPKADRTILWAVQSSDSWGGGSIRNRCVLLIWLWQHTLHLSWLLWKRSLPKSAMFTWFYTMQLQPTKIGNRFLASPSLHKGHTIQISRLSLLKWENVPFRFLKTRVDIVLCGHSHSALLPDWRALWSDSFTLRWRGWRVGGSESGPYQNAIRPRTRGQCISLPATLAWRTGVWTHAAMHTSLSIPGSLVLDVHGKRLDVTFACKFYFTLKKTTT